MNRYFRLLISWMACSLFCAVAALLSLFATKYFSDNPSGPTELALILFFAFWMAVPIVLVMRGIISVRSNTEISARWAEVQMGGRYLLMMFLWLLAVAAGTAALLGLARLITVFGMVLWAATGAIVLAISFGTLPYVIYVASNCRAFSRKS